MASLGSIFCISPFHSTWCFTEFVTDAHNHLTQKNIIKKRLVLGSLNKSDWEQTWTSLSGSTFLAWVKKRIFL